VREVATSGSPGSGSMTAKTPTRPNGWPRPTCRSTRGSAVESPARHGPKCCTGRNCFAIRRSRCAQGLGEQRPCSDASALIPRRLRRVAGERPRLPRSRDGRVRSAAGCPAACGRRPAAADGLLTGATQPPIPLGRIAHQMT
jgi:hypothetical protein